MVRIGATRKAPHPTLDPRISATTSEQRRETPDGSRESLELRGGFIKVRPGEAKVDASTSGRRVSRKWVEETDEVLRDLGLGLDRVGCEWCGVREGGHSDVGALRLEVKVERFV